MENILRLANELSVEDLNVLIDQLKDISDKKKTVQTLRVEFGSYNSRRYGKPWIAKIKSWDTGKQPDLEFGSYYGDDTGGVAEIAAKEGDIIRWGQRDNRGNNTDNNWGIFRNGKLESINAPEARILFKA